MKNPYCAIFCSALCCITVTSSTAQLNLFDPFLKAVEGISFSTERTFDNDNPSEDHDVFFRRYSVSLKYKKIPFGRVLKSDTTSQLIQLDSAINCVNNTCASITRMYKKEINKVRAMSLSPVFGYSSDNRLTKSMPNATINLPNDGLFVKGIITFENVDHFLVGATLSFFNLKDNIGSYTNVDSNKSSTFKAVSSATLTGEIFVGVASGQLWESGIVIFGDAGYRIAPIRNVNYTTLDEKKVSNSELNDKLPHMFNLSGIFIRAGISIDMSPGN